MATTNVFDIYKDRDGVTLELIRLNDERTEWELVLSYPNSAMTITLDRKNLKDLIEALEIERYPTGGRMRNDTPGDYRVYRRG